jgi:hypothetical protein
LPDLTVTDLRLNQHKFDIRFWREGDKTKFEVLRGDRNMIEYCPITAQFNRLVMEKV